MPQQLRGFWAENLGTEARSRYSVYSCRDPARCPQGPPGRCSFGRTGRACADCFLGYASDVDGSCRPCDALSLWPFLLLPIVILGLLPLLVAASILVSRARRVATSIFIVCVIFGQLVVCLQSLEAPPGVSFTHTALMEQEGGSPLAQALLAESQHSCKAFV